MTEPVRDTLTKLLQKVGIRAAQAAQISHCLQTVSSILSPVGTL